jgi:hypothetical protein
MQERIVHIDTQIMAESPNIQRIHRSGLMSAIVEAVGRLPKRPDTIVPPQPINRHERRKAAALGRRGR